MNQENVTPAATEGRAEREEAATVSTRMVLLIILLALGLRVGYVLVMDPGLRFPDEKQYLNIAENFLRGEGLIVTVDPRTNQLLHYPQEIQRTPLYPLTLALLLKAGLSETGIRLVQAVLSALTCAMVYLLATELVGERPGRIAGLIAAFYPFYIYFAGCILSETLFLLLFVTSWYYLVRTWNELGRRAGTSRWLASCLIAGLLGSAAVLTRGSILPVFVCVPLVWLIIGPKRIAGFGAAVLMLLVLAVGMSPWLARNWKRSGDEETGGRLVITTCKVGESLYEAVGPFATGGPNKENTVWLAESERLLHDEYARDRFLLDKSIEYMKNNPGRTLRLGVRKFLRTWNVIPNYQAVRKPFYITVSLVSYVPVLLAAILGLAVGLARVRGLTWLLLPVVVVTVIHMVFVGSVRYRLSVMPFVMILSGLGVWWVLSKVFKTGVRTVEKET